MAFFRRDTEPEPENLLLEENLNINFSPLWEDEQPSSLAQYILPAVQIALLIWILIKL